MRRALLPALLALACAAPQAETEPVALGAAPAGNPTVAVRGDTAFVAWIGMQDSLAAVLLAAVVDGVAGAPVRVNDVPGDAAPHDQAPPQVRVAPDGAIYVAWQNNTVIAGRRFPSSDLRLARSDDGGRSFAPAVYVNSDAGGVPSSHTFHDIAVDDDGALYVSWIDGRVRAAAEQQRGGEGHAMHDPTMPGSEVRVAKSVDGGRTFGSEVVVHDNVCPCCRTALAVQGGNVYVAFRSAVNDVRDVVVAHSRDGGATFSAPVPVHADGWIFEGCPHAGPSLALTADGTLHVSWYTAGAGREGVWYATSRDGFTFSAPLPVLTGAGMPVTQTKLAVDADDTVWITWDDRRSASYAVKTARIADGRVQGERSAGAGFSPSIAAGTAAALAWQTEAGPQLQRLQPR